MIILAIETSCDETAVAVLRDGRTVLSNVVNSQVALHGPYGGVVPEVASRRHVEMLPLVVDEAMATAGIGWAEIDVVAATHGPGLASSLLVGLSAAKGLALRLQKPFIPVNHLHGHMFSPFLSPGAPDVFDVFPFLSLVVSGGHTCLVRVDGVGRFRLLGQTVDDAAGEAFDKGANLLGLGYPGGAEIDRLAQGADRTLGPRFPRTRVTNFRGTAGGGLDPELCFSYSGLKTALLLHLKRLPAPPDAAAKASIAAAYQEAIVDALIERCERALQDGELRVLAVGGGVSLNRRLRERLAALAVTCGVRLLLTEPAFCSDNAAMIAAVAALCPATPSGASLAVDIVPSLAITAVDWLGGV